MKKKFSINDIEEIIRNKFDEKGILNMVGEEKISEIKHKIKDILDNNRKLDEQESVEKQPNQVTNVDSQNPNIKITTQIDPEKKEIEKKETELEIKERELIKKEMDLDEKEKEIEKKDKELKYKPELPEVLKSLEPGSLIIFDQNELSLGAENLSNRKFRMKSNPDDKKSMHELWLQSATTKADVYIVKLEKIGELNFDPYQGISTFNNTPSVEGFSKENDNINKNHDLEQVVKSQNPEEEMLDSINPVVDVSQPIMNTEDIHRQNFENNFRDVIEKIVRDELTKKNIFSL